MSSFDDILIAQKTAPEFSAVCRTSNEQEKDVSWRALVQRVDILECLLDSARKDQEYYASQIEATNHELDVLEKKVAEAHQELKAATEELSEQRKIKELVDAFTKPKEIEVEGRRIVALLNKTRVEEHELLISRILELDAKEKETNRLREAWSYRRKRFRRMMRDLQDFNSFLHEQK